MHACTLAIERIELYYRTETNFGKGDALAHETKSMRIEQVKPGEISPAIPQGVSETNRLCRLVLISKG